MNIVTGIKRARRFRKHSQQSLADAAGIDVMTVSKIERGIVKPRMETLELIAQALDVPVLTLVFLASSEAEWDAFIRIMNTMSTPIRNERNETKR